jgi:hypothetical protein
MLSPQYCQQMISLPAQAQILSAGQSSPLAFIALPCALVEDARVAFISIAGEGRTFLMGPDKDFHIYVLDLGGERIENLFISMPMS